ncbi:uncharacterized protein LOC126747809 isoform X2 [Anthonomus grandis grandis]|nr:uncharacterized protein LOC126747809 isoform X2 [Anthonomus grandis grandis]XP_050312684.1 uncharacterized protein LOC126747809 isoform X2 [Anthonomus grandis grandis]
MPPKGAQKQDLTVILFDLKAAPFSSALDTLSNMILYKQLSTTQPIADKLYLVNAHKTSNAYEYNGLYCIDPTVKLTVLLGEIATMAVQINDQNTSCWLNALDAAKEDLRPYAKNPKIITAQIIFITDLECFTPPTNQEHLNQLIKDLKELDIFLYIVGLSIAPPKTLLTQKDVCDWMAGLELYKKHLKPMERLIKETPHSVICNYDDGIHLVNAFKYFKGTQPWYAPLDFGTKLQVLTSSSRITKRGAPFKLKSTLHRKRPCWVYEDEQETTVDLSDVISGVLLHGKFVKINKDRFKIDGQKDFRFLMFTDAKNVPEYLMQAEATYFVTADPRQTEYILFNTIVEEMAAQNLYGIARKTYAARCYPKFVVLIPKVDLNVKGFLSCEIPFADDLSEIYREDTVEKAPKVKIDENASNFLDSIDVNGESCKIHVPLGPKMMVHPTTLSIINQVKKKYIEEFSIEKNCSPNTSECAFEELKAEWPVRNLEKVKKEKTENDSFDNVDDFNFS